MFRNGQWLPVLTLLMGCLSAISGCSSGPEKCFLEGKASSEGQPISGCHVVFSSPGSAGGASTSLDSDGAFKLKGYVQPGEYVVTFVTPSPPPGMGKVPIAQPIANVPSKYQEEATTDLRVKVVAGKNRFDFDLKP